MEQNNEMKRFIRPLYSAFVLFNLGGVFWFVMLLVLGLGCIIVPFLIGDSYYLIIIGVIQLALLVSLISNIKDRAKALKMYLAQQKDFVDSGKYNSVSEEFNSADVYFDGKLRMSNHYVFGKHSGRVLEYSDIMNIYQYIHETNFAEDARKLKVTTVSGEEIILCKLKTGGKSDDELKKVILAMLIKNNQIRIGYL